MAATPKKALADLLAERTAHRRMLWTFTRQVNGQWQLELLGGTRRCALQLENAEFKALLTTAAAAAYSQAMGDDVSDFP